MPILALKKLWKNKTLFLCLLIACIFSISLIAALPTFENAVHNRMIQQQLRNDRIDRDAPPLVYSVSVSSRRISEDFIYNIGNFRNFVENRIVSSLELPVISEHYVLVTRFANVNHVFPTGGEERLTNAGIAYFEGLFNHVEIIAGRFPEETDDPGLIEVVICENAMLHEGFMLNSLYIRDIAGQDLRISFRVVGIIRKIDDTDPFWLFDTLLSRVAYTTNESFMKTIEVERHFELNIKYVLDYTDLLMADVPRVLNIMADAGLGSLRNIGILRSMVELETELRAFLVVLQVPTIVMLIFFMVMLSGLLLDHDKIEISLLYSRGAGKGRVFVIYLFQAVIIAVISLLVGIPLSLLLCEMMGITTEFLVFDGRTPLIVTVTSDMFIFGLIGAGAFIFSMLLPVVFMKSKSIVSARLNKASGKKTPFYLKVYLDIILVGVSLYGYFSYTNLSRVLANMGDDIENIPEFVIDPMIFLLSTLFFIGFAMLITRLYPYIIRILFRVGRSVWPPSVYASLSSARSRQRSRYIMLFLIFTVSVALFSTSAARTVNRNNIDRAMYDVGADLVVRERWQFIDPDPRYVFVPFNPFGVYVVPPNQYLFFAELPFEIFSNTEGVALATKFYQNDRAQVRLEPDSMPINFNVIAIYPDEFAQVAWWRDDMFDYHFNHLMNAMSVNPNVVLVSRDFMESRRLEHSDEIYISWGNRHGTVQVKGIVYDAFDLFPTWNPRRPDGHPNNTIIMNYELVKSNFFVEPYDVWILLEDGVNAYDVASRIEDSRPIEILRGYRVIPDAAQFRFISAQSRINDIQESPFVASMNGLLTLNFMLSLAVMGLGFLVFWIFEMRNRRLQISIMRSSGMSQASVISMLMWEHIFLTILPLSAGFILGGIGSSMFVPMFELTGHASPLPFRIFMQSSDFIRVGIIVSTIILLAFIMIWYIAARIKISQTLKLGEE